MASKRHTQLSFGGGSPERRQSYSGLLQQARRHSLEGDGAVMGTLALAAQLVNARQWVRALDDGFGFDEPDEPDVKAARKHFDYIDEDGDSGRHDDDCNAELGSGSLGEAHGRRRTSASPARRSTGGRGSLLSSFDASRRRESDAHGRHHQTVLGFATEADAMVSLAFVTNGFEGAV